MTVEAQKHVHTVIVVVVIIIVTDILAISLLQPLETPRELRVHGMRHCAAARSATSGQWESAGGAQAVVCAGARVRTSAGAVVDWMEVAVAVTPI